MFIRPIVHVERLESVVFELSHERVCVIARVWVGRFSVEHMRVLLREDHGAADEVGYPVERSVRVESVHAVVEEEVDFDEVVFIDFPWVDNVCVCCVSAQDGAREVVFVNRGLFRAHVAVLTLDEETAPGEN